jgi:uncharacterized protein (TIGR02145 family)
VAIDYPLPIFIKHFSKEFTIKKNIFYLFSVVCLSLFVLNCKNDPVSSTVQNNDTIPVIDTVPVINPVSNSTISDIDGNKYHIVKIGTQTWTVEDLRTTKYNDGTPIPLVTDDTAWKYTTSDAYCSYKNITSSDTIRKYGLLYNWYAVNTGKLAPKGWHVPSMDDWNLLQNYLINNGYNWDGTTQGNKVAKALASKTDWKLNDTNGTIGNDLQKNNKSGFTALPVGSRYIDGGFGNRGKMGHWWTSTPTYASNVFSIFLSYERDSITVHNKQKTKGFSVRIIKDN